MLLLLGIESKDTAWQQVAPPEALPGKDSLP